MFKKLFCIICFFISVDLVCAQGTSYSVDSGSVVNPIRVDTLSDDHAHEMDIMDVFKNILGRKNNSTSPPKPRKVLYSFVPAVGYTLSTGVVGLASANAAFHLSDKPGTNISTINTSFNYSQYRQVTIPLQANIWTRNNEYNFVMDWRYFKYPQDTYGLGGHSLEANANKMSYSHIRLHQMVLKKVVGAFYVGAGYMLDKRWNIDQEGSNADVTAYGLGTRSVSSGALATVLYDNRKNSINPQEGLYASVRYRINGKFLGSDTNWESLMIDVRKYINFPAGSRNTWAFWSYNWLTLGGKPPYLDLPSTSWDPTNNTGRGYIQGRFRSPQMLYFETEYRFALTQNGLIGGVVFGNAQSFSNWPSAKFDRVAPGAGLGLRIKVNKRSRTNIAIDYGFGLKGSRGLFVNLGEVF